MELNIFKSKEYLPLNHHNIAFKLIYLMILLMVLLSGKFDEFRVYTRKEANEVCKQYVLSQKFYLNKLDKEIIDLWSSRYYKNLNKYIRGFISSFNNNKVFEYELFRVRLSYLIDTTSGLTDDTILFRGERDVDLSRFIVGEINTFSGFIATSFEENVAKNS